MPNIKTRPYGISKDGIQLFQRNGTCYKCSGEIEIGSYNWTYNPRDTDPQSVRKYAHATCPGSWKKDLEPTKPTEPKITEPNLTETPVSGDPKPIEPPKAVEPIVSVKAQLDITGEITSKGKHHLIELIRVILEERAYPFLHGAPGAGKTHLVMQMADDMSLPFVLISCSEDMLKSEMVGSVSPLTGNVISTAFKNAWTNGGVILFDECGLAPGSFLNVMNSAMAQRKILFPGSNEPTVMHRDCFMLFADNSTLYGNDPLFPERRDCGTAFRNRLTYVKFDYDLKIEAEVLRGIMGRDRGDRWHTAVKGIREALVVVKSPIVASPRFAYQAAKWFVKGLPFETVMSLSLYEGRNNDENFEDIVSMAKPLVNRFKGAY